MSGPGDDPATVSRFVAESRVTGMLDHPNIVPVHDLGRTGDGELFLAMKLVGGRSWHDLLHPSTPAEGGSPAATSLTEHLDILINVCNAIAFAHSRGILHRDLKPENVMVGGFGEVLVMDWGIAIDISEAPRSGSHAPHKSSVRNPAGTPCYLAPEMAEARADLLGPWTDVYLLGAILHEILTGRPPHAGPNLASVLLAASRAEPPQLPADISADLRAICVRALSRHPQDRHPDVLSFRQALQDHLQHRESEKIAASAATTLASCTTTSQADDTTRAELYDRFAQAVAGFRQAQTLWPGNVQAAEGEISAHEAYARSALMAGDLGLAESQMRALPADRSQAQALGHDIANARVRVTRSARQQRLLRRGLVAAVAAIVLGLTVGSLLINAQRTRTAAALQRETAERQAKARALADLQVAQEKTLAALTAEERARLDEAVQRDLAEQERQVAQDQRLLADVQRARAEQEATHALHQAWRARVAQAQSLFRIGLQWAEAGRSSEAGACMLRALEIAPRNQIPAGFQAADGEPAWAEPAWIAWHLATVGAPGRKQIPLFLYVVRDMVIDRSNRLWISTPDQILVYDLTTEQMVWCPKFPGRHLALIDGGSLVAVSGPTGEPIRILDVQRKEVVTTLHDRPTDDYTVLAGAVDEPAVAAFDRAGRRVVTFHAGNGKVLESTPVPTGQHPAQIRLVGGATLCRFAEGDLRFPPEGPRLAERSAEGRPTFRSPGRGRLATCREMDGALDIESSQDGGTTSANLRISEAGTGSISGGTLADSGILTLVRGDEAMAIDLDAGLILLRRALRLPGPVRTLAISPDASFVCAVAPQASGGREIVVLHLDPKTSTQPFLLAGLSASPEKTSTAVFVRRPDRVDHQMADASKTMGQVVGAIPTGDGDHLAVFVRPTAQAPSDPAKGVADESLWAVVLDAASKQSLISLTLSSGALPLPWTHIWGRSDRSQIALLLAPLSGGAIVEATPDIFCSGPNQTLHADDLESTVADLRSRTSARSGSLSLDRHLVFASLTGRDANITEHLIPHDNTRSTELFENRCQQQVAGLPSGCVLIHHDNRLMRIHPQRGVGIISDHVSDALIAIADRGQRLISGCKEHVTRHNFSELPWPAPAQRGFAGMAALPPSPFPGPGPAFGGMPGLPVPGGRSPFDIPRPDPWGRADPAFRRPDIPGLPRGVDSLGRPVNPVTGLPFGVPPPASEPDPQRGEQVQLQDRLFPSTRVPLPQTALLNTLEELITSPDGSLVLVTTTEGHLSLISYNTEFQGRIRWTRSSGRVSAACFHPEGTVAALWSPALGRIEIIEPATGSTLRILPFPDPRARNYRRPVLRFSSDGLRLTVGVGPSCVVWPIFRDDPSVAPPDLDPDSPRDGLASGYQRIACRLLTDGAQAGQVSYDAFSPKPPAQPAP